MGGISQRGVVALSLVKTALDDGRDITFGTGVLSERFAAGDMIGRLEAVDHLHGPEVLDSRELGKLSSSLPRGVGLVQLDGYALEQLIVELLASLVARLGLGTEGIGVL